MHGVLNDQCSRHVYTVVPACQRGTTVTMITFVCSLSVYRFAQKGYPLQETKYARTAATCHGPLTSMLEASGVRQ